MMKTNEFLIHKNFLALISIKFILLLRKGIYPYKYMDNWEIFSETLLPEKEDFYSDPNMKDITNAAYTHEKVFVKISK